MDGKDQSQSPTFMYLPVWGQSSSSGLSTLFLSPFAFCLSPPTLPSLAVLAALVAPLIFCLATLGSSVPSLFFLLRLTSQRMQEMPVMHLSALQRHEKLISPVLHPNMITMTATTGRTMARQKFLILSVQRKRRKQGRLKKEVHWLSHICAERLSRVSTMLFTSLFTLSTAALTAPTVVLSSSPAFACMSSTALEMAV